MKKDQECENTFSLYINNKKIIPSNACPYCGNTPSYNVNVLISHEEGEFSSSSFPIWSIYMRFFAFFVGFDHMILRTIFTAVICQNCYNYVLLCRRVEWIIRISGILFTLVFIYLLPTGENFDVLFLLLALVPVIFCGIIAYVFRIMAEARKGFTIIEKNNKKVTLQVRNPEWFRLYEELNSCPAIKLESNETNADEFVIGMKQKKYTNDVSGQIKSLGSELIDENERITIINNLSSAQQLKLQKLINSMEPSDIIVYHDNTVKLINKERWESIVNSKMDNKFKVLHHNM